MPLPLVEQKSAQVILFIDVINHFEFPQADRILKQALAIAPRLVDLKKRARRAKVPVVYVNDNFGQWRSEKSTLLAYCLRAECRGREFVSQIVPDEEDYFVLKPMHSAFYQTPLDILLRHFEASTVILCGLATNSCIMCTAYDAKMRDLGIIVPSDCCAARTQAEHRQALKHIAVATDAHVLRSSSVRLSRKGRP